MNRKAIWIVPITMLAAFILYCCAGNVSKIGSDVGNDEEPSVLVKTVEIDLTDEDYGIGVDKDQPELLEQVNTFLEEVKDNGALDGIISHYMDDGLPVAVVSAQLDDSKDQLVVGSTLDFEPFVYGKIDEYYGIDMELVSLLADYLDKELVIVNSNFETMLMAVKQHKCDICIAGITIDDSRREYVDFSMPYYHVAQHLVVPADSTEFDECKSKEDVEKLLSSKDKNTVVGVENLTTAQYYCEGNEADGYPGFDMTVRRYKNSNVAIEAMLEGDLDYVVEDSVSARFSVNRINGTDGKEDDAE